MLGDVPGRLRRGTTFQRITKHIQIVQLQGVRLANEGPRARNMLDQAFGGKTMNRFPNRDHADTDLGGERAVDQPFTRLKTAPG